MYVKYEQIIERESERVGGILYQQILFLDMIV